MSLWLVRAGRNGEQEDLALDEGLAVIGWRQVPDLDGIGSRDELKALYAELDPSQSVNRIANKASQIWAFAKKIQEGDLIALPLKGRAAVAFGEVTGPYKYRTDLSDGTRHTRPVRWIRTDVPRSSLDQDILDSLGSLLTVGQIKRNNIEERIRTMLAGRRPPVVPPALGPVAGEDEGIVTDTVADLDVEQYARDQIRAFIGRNLRGHDLARLVTELMKAQGYQTRMSPPGADGGVDIIAGRGPLGFDPPRICVQVKSSDDPASVNVLRELQGVVRSFGADHGLFVSWGGFRSSVINEARRLYFEIRLWDGGDLVERVLENYDRLPDEVQAELPLKRIWTLVPEE
jgi:restriction system protein